MQRWGWKHFPVLDLYLCMLYLSQEADCCFVAAGCGIWDGVGVLRCGMDVSGFPEIPVTVCDLCGGLKFRIRIMLKPGPLRLIFAAVLADL